VLASIFLLVSVMGRGTTVERAYLVILDTMLLVYFIPYIYLFVCYLTDGFLGAAAPAGAGARVKTGLVGLSGLVLTVLAMLIATVPPAGTEEPWLFRVKVIGGALGFVLLGGVLYLRRRP
jgi:hypothetical protein